MPKPEDRAQLPLRGPQVSARLLAADGADAGSARAALAAAIIAVTGLPAGHDPALAISPDVDLWVVVISGAVEARTETLRATWARLAVRAGTRLIVIPARNQIDVAGAGLLGTGAQLLCQPDAEDLDAAIRVARKAAAQGRT